MIFGGIWIFYSDAILHNLIKDPNIVYQLSTIKGWFFIIITAFILFFLIKRYAHTIQASILEIDTLIKHLNNLTKYANDIILLLNEDEKIIDANNRALETYGYQKHEILKLNNKDLCSQKEKDLLGRAENSHSISIDNAFETIQIKRDGTNFFAEVSTRIIEVEGRKYYQSIIRDITEKKVAEKSMLESQMNYKELADLLPQVVFEADLKGVLTFGNLSSHEMFGFTVEDLKGKICVFDYILPEDQKRVKDNFVKLIKTGVAAGDQYTAIRRDGSKFSCIIFSNLIIREGKSVGIRGLLIDISGQKRIEEELRNSEERYKQLIESLPVAFAIHSEEKIIYVNAAAVKLMGADDKEKLTGKSILDFVHPEYREVVLTRIENMLSPSYSQNLVEEKIIRPDGSVIDVEISASPILYQDKMAIQIVVNDISWRKAAEKALIESEEKYRKLVETANDAIIITDAETGNIIDINLKAEELIGQLKSKIIGLHQSLLYSTDDLQKYNAYFRNLNISEPQKTIEDISIKHYSGYFIPVEINSNIFVLGGKKIVQGIYRDITDRKQAEEQIRILSRAVEQSPISIVITDTFGNIEYVNLKFAQLTGYTLPEVLGKNPRILKSGNNPVETYKNLWESITSGKEWHGELHNKKKDGTLYWEYVTISPVRDNKGNISHFLAVKEDITAKKIMTEELIIAKEEAEASDRLKSEFLAQMSHEIRTPLNIILSYNYLLKEELEENSKTKYAPIFNSIDSASKRLLRTIDLILNMSAIQTGKLKINFSNVNLYSILNKLVEEFISTAESRNIALLFYPTLNNPNIITDEYLITEIFQNIIDNALKYTNKGKVEIIVYENKSKQICVDISDTGIGITKEYLPKLFQPFTQQEAGYSRKYEGNGLGLALVKKYSEMIGSEIFVKSEKDKGSTFTVIFKN
jgi:PAS domain S-box-containing protein